MFTIALLGLPIFTAYDARLRGWISKTSSILISVIFLVLWLYVAIASGWVLKTNPGQSAGDWSFTAYYVSFAVLTILYFAAVWFLSNKEGRQHVHATWWLVWLMLAIMIVSYFGYYGPLEDPALIFPWGTGVAIVVGIIAYIWGVRTGFETDEIKEIVKAEGSDQEGQ